MCAAFYRNDEVKDITGANGKPSLEFRWNRTITFESTCYPVTSRGYSGFKSGTLQQHLKDIHPGTNVPYALFKVSDRKREGSCLKSFCETVRYNTFVKTHEHITNTMNYNKLNKFVQRKLEVAEGDTDTESEGEV